jgi:hypothetical protein
MFEKYDTLAGEIADDESQVVIHARPRSLTGD